ncbi:MAG: hypothetical protein IIT72_01060 [Lachnospiraceae bacterium]|nr:hypothetical protein [Lachnospiraceae bacterium]MBQ2577058.1 hypothetical protein [Lachnospiraceae bacterium]MBQ5484066.1 hypothetical protein [Lachnospiraceae bacterium]
MYLQDLHVENFVSRKPSTVSKVLKIVMIVLAVITFVLGLVVPYLLIMPLLFAALAWYYQMNSQIDFDYSYTNGVIEIAKVMNKSRRKQMLSVEMKDVVVVAVSKSDPVRAYVGRRMKTYDCTAHEEGVKYYCMIFKNPDHSNQEEKLLFQPDEEFLDAMRTVAPRSIHKD